jgi:DNA-binding HxlR family transcriptional regulator
MGSAQGGTGKSPGNKEGTPGTRLPTGRSQDFVVVREVLNRVGDKWSVLAIVLLGEDSRRFSELRRMIDGVSQRMLTLTLRNLERDGLVRRSVFPTVPPRVEYALTPLGRTLLGPVTALATWATRNGQHIYRARLEFVRREATRQSPAGPSGAARPLLRLKANSVEQK